jgi:hypothetical protein
MTPAQLMIVALCVLPTSPANRYDREWLRLIQLAEGANCPVKFLSRYDRIIGFNSHHSETWRVETCHGEMEYGVDFYPKDEFPGRKVEFEVKPVAPSPPPPTK